jgi:hypothetical protein
VPARLAFRQLSGTLRKTYTCRSDQPSGGDVGADHEALKIRATGSTISFGPWPDQRSFSSSTQNIRSTSSLPAQPGLPRLGRYFRLRRRGMKQIFAFPYFNKLTVPIVRSGRLHMQSPKDMGWMNERHAFGSGPMGAGIASHPQATVTNLQRFHRGEGRRRHTSIRHQWRWPGRFPRRTS